MVTKVTIKPSFYRKIKRGVEIGKRRGKAAIDKMAKAGLKKAQSIVPVYTGDTFRAIKIVPRRDRNGDPYSAIEAVNILDDGHVRSIANFDLVRWMHESPKAKKHIKTGEPKFMDKTATYLRSNKKSIIGNINKRR